MSSIRQHGEILLARLAFRVVPNLSRAMVLRWSRVAGTLAYYLAGHLRRVGFANLQIAYGGTLSRDEKRRILKASFQNFALVVLDSFWFLRETAQRLETWVRFDPGFGEILRPARQVCVTAHLGNWEVLGQAVAARGFPLASVAAPLANPDVDALFLETRRQTGQQVFSKHGVLRKLLRALRSDGKIALVIDQNTKPSEGGLYVDFFGLPVPVTSAPALLAEKTDSPLVVGVCIPQPDGTYYAPAPLFCAAAPTDIRSRTQQLTDLIERVVRAYPSCWLWCYKRWKYVAPDIPRERYPFYSKALRADDERIARTALGLPN